MNYRNRNLLDLSHLLHQCSNCNAFVVEGLEPAHQNGIGAGKGQSIKSRDNRHAALCHRCHAWYDSGANDTDPSGIYAPTRDGKNEMWTRAHLITFDKYWANDWVRVNNTFRR